MDVKLKDTIIDANTGADAIQRAPIVDYNTGRKCLRIGDISNQRKYNEWGYTKVNEENYKKYKLEKEDILIARTGSTIGINTFIEKDYKSVYNNGLIRLRIDKSKYNSKFIYYVIQTNKFKNYINGIAFGTTGQPNMKINDLLNFKFKYIPLEIQNKIVKILDNLDKKIELNNQINDNLLEQLQLIFDEWFGKYDCDNLPNDWKIKKIKDIATFSQGVQVPIENQKDIQKDGYIRFIRIVDITQNNKKDIRYIKDTERGRVVENEIFMIRYGTPGILSRNYNGIIANNLFKIIPKSDEVTSNYLYSLLNTNYIQNYIKGNASSSTMPAINFSTLNDREIIIPTKDELKKFDEISEIIRLKQLSIIKENNILEQLRDTLLLKLMNGEIALENIEI